MNTADCIFEIGVEEIPARFLPVFEQEMARYFTTALEKNLLCYKDITVLATPRRLGIIITELAQEQTQKQEEMVGPPVQIAFTAEKQATKALEAFLQKTGSTSADIYEKNTEKGLYIATMVTLGGNATKSLLPKIFEDAIHHLASIQKMRWGEESVCFARPIRWLLALYGSESIPCSYGSLTNSGTPCTYGHRIYAPQALPVNTAQQYLEVLTKQGFVIPSASERKALIQQQMEEIAQQHNATIVENESLLNENTYLCEYPSVMLGNVEERFLALPKEIFLTSIEVHQRSFGLLDNQGNLLPYFITITNNDPVKNPLIKSGWEKVLRARLEDALFFYNNDLKVPLKDWLDDLENVTFVAKLGSMKEKSLRLKALVTHFAHHIDPSLKHDVARAALFSKVDLVSQVVGEFDTLQGIMSGIYTKFHGENTVVSTAITEHYLPDSAAAPLPKSLAGILLSLADKMDLLVGCFGMNLVSTGTTDPHGLRRATLGIIRILLEHNLDLPLSDSLQYAYTLYGERPWYYSRTELLATLKQFYKTRVKQYLHSLGYESPAIDAVLAVDAPLYAQYKRLQSLTEFMQKENSLTVCLLFKRIVNILEQESMQTDQNDATYTTELFQNETETALHNAMQTILPQITQSLQEGHYAKAMELTTELNTPLHNFFENTMILDSNMSVRKNRLYLLETLRATLAQIANFTALQV